MGYVSRKGYSLVDNQLYLPDEWFEPAHAERRKTCGVPEDLSYQTIPEIGLKLLQVAVKRNEQAQDILSFQWVAADELYGDSTAFAQPK